MPITELTHGAVAYGGEEVECGFLKHNMLGQLLEESENCNGLPSEQLSFVVKKQSSYLPSILSVFLQESISLSPLPPMCVQMK